MIYSPLLGLEVILPKTKSKRSYAEFRNKRLFLAPAGKNIRSYRWYERAFYISIPIILQFACAFDLSAVG